MNDAANAGGERAGDVNYRFLVHYVAALSGVADPIVLDFGCGNGLLVSLLREAGAECYGADVFYGGAQFEQLSASGLLANGVVREIQESGRLPFDDGFFDIVISNQVFEHVDRLSQAVDEIHRVLKDDGIAYHHFPSREVIREGHIGIPLAHRLPPGDLRYAYTVALRRFGFGYNKGDSPPDVWAREKLDWIDRYCFYRPYAELSEAFARHFAIRHREIDYCRFRARSRAVRFALRIEPLTGIYQRIFRRLAFMALEMRKSRS